MLTRTIPYPPFTLAIKVTHVAIGLTVWAWPIQQDKMKRWLGKKNRIKASLLDLCYIVINFANKSTLFCRNKAMLPLPFISMIDFWILIGQRHG